MPTMKTVTWRALGLTILLALPACPAHGQLAGFEDTADVVVVEIPVEVTRKGEPVGGLTANDFTIADNGRDQEILAFEEVELLALPAGPDPGRVPLAARRHLLLLFDLSFSSPTAIARGRPAVEELVDRLHPTDLAGVALYSAAHGVQFVLGFTSDREQVKLAVDTLGMPDLIERVPDVLSLVLGERRADAADGPGIADLDRGISSRALTSGADSLVRSIAERGAWNERADEEYRVIAMTRDLKTMAEAMAGIEGRKYVVYLSEGFDGKLLTGDGGVGTRGARETGQLWDVSSDESYGSTRLQNQLEEMLEAFRRAGCVVEAVDLAGLRTEGYGGGSETALFLIANDTGGHLYRTFNDLGDAMEEMLSRTAVTYVLSFQPRKLKADGKFHRLKVKVRDQPRGTRVHHRAGYFAPRPFAETDELERRLGAAELILGGEDPGSIRADVLAVPMPGGGGKAYVPVLLEVDGPGFLRGVAADVVPLELHFYAVDATGSIRDFANQAVELDLARLGPALSAGGLEFWAHLGLAPGQYSARFLVRNLQTGAYALRQLPIGVPDFAAGHAILLPPLFPEPTDKWVLIRERPARQRQLPYPFVNREGPYVPAAAPEVPASGTTPVYVMGFNLGSGRPEVTGKVTPENGAAVEGAFLRQRSEIAADAARHVLAWELETINLGPGTYTLTVTVETDERRQESSVQFVVVENTQGRARP